MKLLLLNESMTRKTGYLTAICFFSSLVFVNLFSMMKEKKMFFFLPLFSSFANDEYIDLYIFSMT